MKYKKCSICKQIKPLGSFYPRVDRRKGSYCSECKSCKNKKIRQRLKNNPMINWAKRSVKEAKRSGRLIAPMCCENCGEKKLLDAHHSDYSQPLKVDWLCRKCHLERHRQLNLRITA
jgi:hypothetical protein